MKIPDMQQTVMPYLIINNAVDFIRFAEKVFGAKEIMRHTREDGQAIMHAQVMIGGCTIMFADASEQFPATATGLFIYVENADETYEKALAEGAFSIMPPGDQSYGRSCGVKDIFGTSWWVTSL